MTFPITQEELKTLYVSGLSAQSISKKLGVSKKSILNHLHELSDWNFIRLSVLSNRVKARSQLKLYSGICEYCGSPFQKIRKSRFCSKRCIGNRWGKNFRKINKDQINQVRKYKRSLREKKITEKKEWHNKLLEKIKMCHKRNLEKVCDKLLDKIDRAKNSIVVRSKKKNVECSITVKDLREVTYARYGSPCIYCSKILTIKNFVFDHIIPMSKGGDSTKDNIQIICKTCNNVKGSLDNKSFQLLLTWLETIPPDLKLDIRTRLAGGIH